MTNTAAYLKKYDLEDLHQLAVNTGVTNEEALDKEGLITEISKNLLNADVLEYAYLYSDEPALTSWQQGSKNIENGRNLSLADVYGLYIKIGRASCRERVIVGGGVDIEEKRG